MLGKSAPKPTFFATPKELRAWFETNHDKRGHLWIGFHKVGTGKPSVTYQQALDQALAYGWIDGVRKSLGDETYTIRYTPRRSRSIWSQVNIRRIAELEEEGRMHPAGIAAFEKRSAERQNLYSFENRDKGLSPEFEREIEANEKAWTYFSAQPPGYRRTAGFWVMSAKQEATRRRRLRTLIADSAKGMRVAPLVSPGDRKKHRAAEAAGESGEELP